VPRKNNAPPRTPSCHPRRKHLAKGLCKPCYDEEYGRNNRTLMNAKSRAWARRHPERIQTTRLRYRYGVSPEEIRAKLNAQSGFCAICRAEVATDIDHNHAKKKVRGILCGECNRGLGLFKENIPRLLRAVEYLKLWEDEEQLVVLT
jgi:hypothetical protein